MSYGFQDVWGEREGDTASEFTARQLDWGKGGLGVESEGCAMNFLGRQATESEDHNI